MQDFEIVDEQAPAPLQTGVRIAIESAEHISPPQTWLAPGLRHEVSEVPSHVPPHLPVPVHRVREPRGSPVTILQLPTLSASLHAWHTPSQSALQHTPSTQ